MKTAHDIIIRPVLTERSYDNMALKKYTFVVDKAANKYEIKKAVEDAFGVKVAQVNTLNRPGHGPQRDGAQAALLPRLWRDATKATAATPAR